MDIYQIHADSIGALQVEQGDVCPVISWKGADYQVLPGTSIDRKSLESGGFNLSSDLVFTALVKTFLDTETGANNGISDAVTLKNAIEETEIVYLGDRYKISAVHINAGALQCHFEANSSNKR